MPHQIYAGSKKDQATPVIVRGYFTEYADITYQPRDADDLADVARSEAYLAQVEVLQKAWDLTTCWEAKDVIRNEIRHFQLKRRNMIRLLPTERKVQCCFVEGEIWAAIRQARNILAVHHEPPAQPQTRDGIAYRTTRTPQTKSLKRKRSDSVVECEAPPARRTKVVHLLHVGQSPHRLWEAQKRALHSACK
ncbi:hypothetical protein DOTSEDRAFT_39022 [Dothistroma septosporum NZE10]|uniref:Uncharacterized protein n=1 Tax=Dothistroma septosporum (strain NZE10 / CBS 128990) TaxID=675120 RepID=M2XH72_DOTSN|nr:hypothetical protein DOTSEDRAFT_39022 [Dothistroma septosporum NZE10]